MYKRSFISDTSHLLQTESVERLFKYFYLALDSVSDTKIKNAFVQCISNVNLALDYDIENWKNAFLAKFTYPPTGTNINWIHMTSGNQGLCHKRPWVRG
jgi:hypothetical protein